MRAFQYELEDGKRKVLVAIAEHFFQQFNFIQLFSLSLILPELFLLVLLSLLMLEVGVPISNGPGPTEDMFRPLLMS